MGWRPRFPFRLIPSHFLNLSKLILCVTSTKRPQCFPKPNRSNIDPVSNHVMPRGPRHCGGGFWRGGSDTRGTKRLGWVENVPLWRKPLISSLLCPFVLFEPDARSWEIVHRIRTRRGFMWAQRPSDWNSGCGMCCSYWCRIIVKRQDNSLCTALELCWRGNKALNMMRHIIFV